MAAAALASSAICLMLDADGCESFFFLNIAERRCAGGDKVERGPNAKNFVI